MFKMKDEWLVADKAKRENYTKVLDIGKDFLYFSYADCKKTGTTEAKIIKTTEQGMIDYSKRVCEMPAKIGIHPMSDCLMHAMPAYMPEQYANVR